MGKPIGSNRGSVELSVVSQIHAVRNELRNGRNHNILGISLVPESVHPDKFWRFKLAIRRSAV
jgi:hypothetical protein